MPKSGQKQNDINKNKEKTPPLVLGKYALSQLSLSTLETFALFIF